MKFQICVNEDNQDKIYKLFCHSGDNNVGIESSPDFKMITLNYTKGNSIQLDFLETDNWGDYAYIELKNKKINYDVDLSNVKKGYNFAFYTCSLTKYDQYKDAQSWDSRTEIDLMESNRSAYHFTLHQKYDKGGVVVGYGGSMNQNNIFQSNENIDRDNLFGPNRYIDTNKMIHVEITFSSNSAHIQLQQDNKKIWQTITNFSNQLSSELDGKKHTPILSLWYGGWGMNWLDGNTPNEDESHISEIKATISNITITSGG
jgi:hypothetical protein